MGNELKSIRCLLRDKIGINPDAYSTPVWTSLLKRHMGACGLEELGGYAAHLLKHPKALQELAESFVVPETWFFREEAAIDFLVHQLHEGEWVISTSKPFSILSLPCSTGEEPYSIAMALAQKGISADRVSIEGVDLSAKAIKFGRVAIYGEHAFRRKDLAFRSRFFKKSESEGQYQLNSSIRNTVRLRQGNLLNDPLQETYDAIFCRYLLVYLHRDAQEKALRILCRHLSPRGILFVGVAEIEILKSFGFVPFGPAKVGAFRRPERKVKKEPSVSAGAIVWPRFPVVGVKDAKGSLSRLSKAKKFADEGLMEEAVNLCKEHLKEHCTDPFAYFLLGVIAHAQGQDVAAEEYFLKAVYLKVDFYEALIYLSLLADTKGNKTQADLFRVRAEKAKGKGQNHGN